MKKLLSKICTFLLGASLIAGAGVVLAKKSASQASATDAVGACCDLSANTASVTGYAKEHNYGDYKVYGGQNNNGAWAYFKFGGKKSKAADPAMVTEAYVKSTVACTYDIKRIDVVLLAGAGATNTVTITMDADISSSADFSSKTTTNSTTVDQTKAATLSIQPSSGTFGSNKYYCVNFHISNNTTTNGVLFIEKINFIYESTTPRGEISIHELSTSVLNVGSSASLSYDWTPASGSDATISSYSYTSSNSSVLSISGNTITGLAPGKATVTLHAVDSLSEVYDVVSQIIFVTKSYGFAVGDDVVLYSSGASKELSGISTTSTIYGEGADYSETPNGVYPLEVEEGSLSGSFSFKNGSSYLNWVSGNSMNSSSSKTANSSWFVIAHDDYMQICNAAALTREIWWNEGTPRFACYEGKTPETSGYNSVSLLKIEEVPIRGTLSITSPTDKIMRGDASGSLVYSWTANPEADSVTISSHTWTSSNPAVISVDGDTYTAEGPGKAKLTLTATDSTGEEYTVVGNEIEVIDVVSGSIEKKTSVAINDSVTFVCEADGTQLSGIASNIGQYVYYSNKPADVYMFVLEAGSEANTFALKHDDKYLSWTGHGSSTSANIGLVDAVDDYASWTISFDEGNAVVSNVGLDGEAHRYIAWNHGSPRFAAYKSGQTAIQLYGPASAVYNAAAFAQDLLDETDGKCSTYVDGVSDYATFKTYFEGVWETLAGEEYFGKLGSSDVETLATADANKDSSDVVEQAMARYDLLTVKYQLDNFITGRTPVGAPAYIQPRNVNSNASTIIIVVVALTSITSIGVLLVIKRRRSLVK